jgi:[ribosomal protein S5]-alanine N-acetyltransferase
MKTIKTERLIIRRYDEKDVPQMIDMLHDYSIHRFTRVPYPYTKQIATAFAKRRDKRNLHLGVFLSDSGKLVAGVGLKDIDKKAGSAELGYLCHRKHRNEGYVTEGAKALLNFAFNSLNLKRIEIDCSIKNKASARVIKKIGAKREGILRSAIPWKSSWEDKLVHSILKEEFNGRKALGNISIAGNNDSKKNSSKNSTSSNRYDASKGNTGEKQSKLGRKRVG